MVDKVLALQNIAIQDLAKTIGKESIEVISVLSPAEGGKYLVNADGGSYVLTFTSREISKVQVQKQLIDALAVQGVPVSRIISTPVVVNGYTSFLSDYLEGHQTTYSTDVINGLTATAARIAKTAYSLFPNTGARHDSRPIYRRLSKDSTTEFISANDFYLLGADLEDVVAQRLMADGQCHTSYIHADIKAQNAITGSLGLQIFDFDNLRKDAQILDLAYLLEDYFLYFGQIDLAQIQLSINGFQQISMFDNAQMSFFPLYMRFAIIDKLLFSLTQCVSFPDDPGSKTILEKRLALWKEGNSKLKLEP